MTIEQAPVHGRRPPRPSIFPTLAVAVLGAGAYAANAARPAVPDWLPFAAGAAGLVGCLAALQAGQRIFRSRRTGVYAGFILAGCAPLLQIGVPGAGHLLIALLALPALALGMLLDRYSERCLGPASRTAVRFALDGLGTAMAAAAVVLLLKPTLVEALGNGRVIHLESVPLACFALAGVLIGFMGLAGDDRRWPLAEAVLVSFAAAAVWVGRASC